MKNSKELEDKLKDIKPLLSEQFHVKEIAYFGSFATGLNTENSDIDILVEFSKPLGWEFFDLKDLLEKELNRKVDLVSIKALKAQLSKMILAEARFI